MPRPERMTRSARGKLAGERRQRPPRSQARSIAFTGVASFLGRSLLRSIAADPQHARTKIVMLDVRKPDFPLRNAKYYKLDLTLPLADERVAEILSNEGCDTFVHLSFHQSPIHDTSASHELEVIGTLYVLNACQQVGLPRFVMASTTMAYGALPSNPNFLTPDHPLRGSRSYAFVRDKVEAERLVAGFRAKNPSTIVTVLRCATTLGPHVDNVASRYFNNPVIYTVLGRDPLMQFLHEEDAVRAFRIAVDGRHDGVYNVVGRKVLPLSTILKVAGKFSIALPASVLYPAIDALWLAGMGICPAAHLDYLRYLWVADGSRTAEEMGFEARYTTLETVEHFVGHLRLRKLHLAASVHREAD